MRVLNRARLHECWQMETLTIPGSDRGQLACLGLLFSASCARAFFRTSARGSQSFKPSEILSRLVKGHAELSFLSGRSLCLLVHSCSRLQQRDVALPAEAQAVVLQGC